MLGHHKVVTKIEKMNKNITKLLRSVLFSVVVIYKSSVGNLPLRQSYMKSVLTKIGTHCSAVYFATDQKDKLQM